MRELLSGNDAVARGAFEAGAEVAAAYPGTPSTEILEAIGTRYGQIYAEWSVNEKVAFEVAFGAAVAGKRALAAMKHVGVNVAADALLTASYTGVAAGLVLVSADDPGMHSSQNEQDNRYFAKLAKIPMFEPSDSQEAKDFTVQAFALSEQYDTPVLLRLTTRVCHGKGLVEIGERQALPARIYEKNPNKYVMLPAYARERHKLVEARQQQLESLAETSAGNRVEMGDPAIGIITSGVAYQYAREAAPEASFFKLGMTYPLPQQALREFARRVDRLYVIEELEPYLEEHLRGLGLEVTGKAVVPRVGELSPDLVLQALGRTNGRPAPAAGPAPGVALPRRPPVLCPGCPHRGLFHVLRKVRATVSGDIGCYTLSALPPLESMDTCVCMGASIGIAQGLSRALTGRQAERIVAVLGDSTFIHAGIPSLVNAVYSKANITVIIADNRTTAMTGHQDNPGTGKTLRGESAPELDFEAVARAVGVEYVVAVDPLDMEATEKVVREAMSFAGPAVVVARRACVLVDRDQFAGPLQVDTEQCSQCKLCIRLGCPAISMEEDGAVIDQALCAGCELCAQQCPEEAISRARGAAS